MPHNPTPNTSAASAGAAPYLRVSLEGIRTLYEDGLVARFVCELPASCEEPLELRVSTRHGLPMGSEPVLLSDVVELRQGGPVRIVRVSVHLEHARLGVRLVATCEHEGGELRDALGVTGRQILESLDGWLEQRRNVQNWDGYDAWFRAHRAMDAELNRQRQEVADWDDPPLVSIVVPLFRTPEAYLREMLTSVLRQSYANFELVLVNASPEDATMRSVLEWHDDPRIRVVEVENAGIALNTNVGVAASRGSYVCFLDHDDFLERDALYWYVKEIRLHPDADLLFCNEDMWTDEGEGRFFGPKFKGAWDLDRLLDGNQVCHMLMVSRRALDLTERTGRELDGAQDYDLTLKVAEVARSCRFVPRMLYHWRSHEDSSAENLESKPYLLEAGRLAVARHLRRTGVVATVDPGPYPLTYRTTYRLRSPRPLASVVAVGVDEGLLRELVEGLAAVTDYDRWELVVPFPGARTAGFLERRVVPCEVPANASWAERARRGVAVAKGDVVVLLDEGASPEDPAWLRELVGRLQRPDVAVAAPLALEPDGFVASCGLTVLADGSFVPMGAGLAPQDTGYMQYLSCAHGVSAVPGACVALRRDALQELGGLARGFAGEAVVADVCLRARAAGKAVALVPSAAVSRFVHGGVADARAARADRALLAQRHPSIAEADPTLDPALNPASPWYQVPNQQ